MKDEKKTKFERWNDDENDNNHNAVALLTQEDDFGALDVSLANEYASCGFVPYDRYLDVLKELKRVTRMNEILRGENKVTPYVIAKSDPANLPPIIQNIYEMAWSSLIRVFGYLEEQSGCWAVIWMHHPTRGLVININRPQFLSEFGHAHTKYVFEVLRNNMDDVKGTDATKLFVHTPPPRNEKHFVFQFKSHLDYLLPLTNGIRILLLLE